MKKVLKLIASFYTRRTFSTFFINSARICIKPINQRYHSNLSWIKLPHSSASKNFKNLREAINVIHTSAKSRIKCDAVELSRVEQLLSEATEPLNIISFSKFLYSLRIYEFNEVKNILPLLSNRCSKLKQSFDAQAVGNTLYGLQNMSSDSSEVRAVLRELGKKIAECTEPLDAQAVGNALYGLQNMNSDSSEVRAVLRELGKKIAECTEPLSAQAVGNAFTGIQQLTIDGDLKNFVITSLNQISEYDRDCSFGDICTLYQSLALLDENSNFISLLKELSLYGKFIEQKKRLLELLYNHEKKRDQEGMAMSKSEQKYFLLAKRALDTYPELTLSNNEFLYGFEVDIIVRKQIGNQTPRILVIEVDGPSHRTNLASKRFDDLRDTHLTKEYGVIVERWELVVTDKLKSENIIKKFKESFDNFLKE